VSGRVTDSEHCKVCELVVQLLAEGHAHVREHKVHPEVALTRVIGKAYAEGLGEGWNIREKATFQMLCRAHADEVEQALRRHGSPPIPIAEGGTG
jgi:hypothetical protein